MNHQDDAAAMAFAVLRNRGYRFLAVSADGVVVANGSPTLAIDVSRPVAAAPKPDMDSNRVHRPRRGYTKRGVRKLPYGYVQKVANYKAIMHDMQPGDSHLFPPIAGTTIPGVAMALSNACTRYWGSGHFSTKTSPQGVTVTRK